MELPYDLAIPLLKYISRRTEIKYSSKYFNTNVENSTIVVV